MRSVSALLVIFTLNSVHGKDSLNVASYNQKNVEEKKIVQKREAAEKSSDFFPDWVPFKNLNGDQLGDFVPVSKRTPRKRLAPPFNYLLKSVADSETSDDYFDKSPGGSEDDYEKSDWSDVNRDVIPVTSDAKLNHTDLTDIDGVVTSIQKPYVIHVARDENNTKLGHNHTPSKQKNKKPFKTLDRQGSERENYDPYQETGPLKEIKRSKKKLYEEFDYDEIDKVNTNDNRRENKKVNIFKIEGLNKHSNGKRQTDRDAQNTNEDERLKELIESELFIVKKLYGKQDVLPFPNESDQFEEHGDMLVGKYDEQTTAIPTTVTTSTVKPLDENTTIKKKDSQYDIDLYNLKQIQSVFENPSLYLETENENNNTNATTEPSPDEIKRELILETIDDLKKKHQNDNAVERKETLDVIRKKIKSRQEKAKIFSRQNNKHDKRTFLVPDIDSKAGEPTLFFPSKYRYENRKKKNREYKKMDITSDSSTPTLSDSSSKGPSNLKTTHIDNESSETELLGLQAATRKSNQEIGSTAADLDALYQETDQSSAENRRSNKKIEPSSLETEPKNTDALSSETGPSGSETGPSSSETEVTGSGSSSSETGPSGSDTRPSSSEEDPHGKETGPSSSESKPSISETGPSSSETEPSGLETGPSAAETGPSSSETDLPRTTAEHSLSKTVPEEITSSIKSKPNSKTRSSLKIEPLPWFSEDTTGDHSVGDSSGADSKTQVDAIPASTENKKNYHTDGSSEKAFTEQIIENKTTEPQQTTTVKDQNGSKQKPKHKLVKKARKRKKTLKNLSSTTSTTEINKNAYKERPESLIKLHNLDYAICTSNETCTKIKEIEDNIDEVNAQNAATSDVRFLPQKNETKSENQMYNIYHTISRHDQEIKNGSNTTSTTLRSKQFSLNNIEDISEKSSDDFTTTSRYHYFLQYENYESENLTDITTKNYNLPQNEENDMKEELSDLTSTTSKTQPVLQKQEKELFNDMIITNKKIQNLFQNRSEEIEGKIYETNYNYSKTEEEMKRDILEKFNDINKSYNRILKNAFNQNDANVLAIQKDIKEIKDLISTYDNVKKSFNFNVNESETNTKKKTSELKIEQSSSGFVDIVVDKLHGVIKAANSYNVASDENSKQYISISEQHRKIWEKLKRLAKLTLPKLDEQLSSSERQLTSEEDPYISVTMQPSLHNLYKYSENLSNIEYKTSPMADRMQNAEVLDMKIYPDIDLTPKNKTYVQDHNHKKGGGKEYHSKDEEEHGEHGKKAYESNHENSKKSKGKHDKEDHLGKYEDHGGHDKYHHDESGHTGTHHHVEKGKKHAQYEESGKHSKGHSTKGSHDIHKKEEYEKNVEFFDEDGDFGVEEKQGNMAHEKRHSSGDKFNLSKLKSGHEQQQKGASGADMNDHFNRLQHGQRLTAGHDEHRARGKSLVDGGDQANWVYHHGNPAQTANFVVIDRRGDQWPVVYGKR